MTDEEILQLAKQAWKETGRDCDADAWFTLHVESFKQFASLILKAKRDQYLRDSDKRRKHD